MDQASKEFFKNKEVLAIILKGVVKEYADYSYTEIMDFIEADTISSESEVTPGRTNTRISGEDKEFIALNEKFSYFDTLFKAINPKMSNEEFIVNLHIDVEPQKSYHPGYPIEKRGLYYLARQISSQLTLVTDTTDYSVLEKCYSIWICRDHIPKDEQFSVSIIEMSNTKNYGECHPNSDNFNLMTLVIIRLGDGVFKELKEKEINGMMEFLHAVMYPHKDDFMETVKKYIDFSKNEELWKESDQMTGLGMSILEEGRSEGRIGLCIEMVKEGVWTISFAAEKAGISEEKMQEEIDKMAVLY